jgi:hypothetical protein
MMRQKVCPECGKQFREDFALTYHRKNAHGIQPPEQPKHLLSGLITGIVFLAFVVYIVLVVVGVQGAVIMTVLAIGVGLPLWIPRGAMLGIGIVLLVVAGFLYLGTRSFVSGATASEGIVVEMVEHEDYEGDTFYVPIVEFRTGDGKVIRLATSALLFAPRLRMGNRVNILYHPANPSKARIGSWASTWGWSIVTGTIGLVAVVLGLWKSRGRPSKGGNSMMKSDSAKKATS